MKLSFVQPRSELRPYLESLWVFESSAGMPPADLSMAAPNGCPKLVIPYANSLVSIANGRASLNHEGGLYFVGNRDTQTFIQSSARETGFVVIEFAPHGAFPIFGIPMDETANGLFDSEVLFGRWARDVREILRNLQTAGKKADFIQEQLVILLNRARRDNSIIEFCVRALRSSSGRIAIGELEHKTGYSRRYLDLLFRRHVGLAPKILAGIFRFQTFYRKWAQGVHYDALKADLYEYYYDQSHFIKEFQKMTGYSPRRFTLEVPNEFGRLLSLK